MNIRTIAVTIAAGCASIIPSIVGAEVLKVDGGEIFYETVGEGMPIMVMHGGLGLDHTYLRPYFDQLSDLGQVVYYDHRGNGKSSRPEDFSTVDFTMLVNDAEALREHLGQDKMILIGHSYGGFVALKYAIEHSDNLAGLALVDTTPVLDYQPSLSGNEDQMAALGALFSAPVADDEEMRKLWNTVIPMYFHNPDPDLLDKLNAETTYSGAAWNRAAVMLGSYNTLDDLGKITAPTLAIAGRFDGITPPEPGAERIAAGIPGAEAVSFENSGHYPFIEEEDAFFATLRDWIGGL